MNENKAEMSNEIELLVEQLVWGKRAVIGWLRGRHWGGVAGTGVFDECGFYVVAYWV